MRVHVGIILTLAVLAVGCSRSSSPTVQDLVKVRTPTFNYSTSANILSPTIAYVVSGECDSTAYLTEYAIGDGEYVFLACVNDKFTIPVKVNGQIKVSARSKGKYTYTDVAIATVRFIAPPASDSVNAVASSNSDSSDLIGVGTQTVLGTTFEGNTVANGGVKVHTYLPRNVYEQ